MTAEQELVEFFDLLYGDVKGYVYLPVKSVSQGFHKFMIPWPAKKDAVVRHVLKWAADETAEIFYSPALFKERKPIQDAVLGSWFAWVDFDGNYPEVWPEDIAPRPSLEIQSSTNGKRHCYWALEEFTSTKQLQDINRALAYALGADLSGWDANQFLRPPHTVNRKYDKPINTRIVFHNPDLLYSHEDFSHIPVPKEAIKAQIEVAELPTIEEVLDEAKWDDALLDLFHTDREEMQHQGRDRSSALQRLAYEGAEHSWTDEQIMAVLIDADDRWQKYTGRTAKAREKILVDLINRARAKVGYEPSGELEGLAKALGVVKVVEEPETAKDQVLFSIKELAELPGIDEWLVEDLLVPRGIGLFTGRPGVGKTQLACQLGADLATGRGQFLNWATPTDPLTVLVMSLEMNQYQIGHIAKPIFERYPELDQTKLPIYAKGEPLALDEESGQAYFEALLSRLKPDVVIVDSLSHMVKAELTSDTDMKVAFEFLQRVRNQYDFGLVIIHHHRKKANDAQSKKRPNDLSDVYGSFYITAAIDFDLDLEVRPDDEEEGIITMTQLKNRYARLPEPVKLIRNNKLAFESVDDAVKEFTKRGDDDEGPGMGF